MNIKSNLSANIKFLREKNGLNQGDFGKIISKGASLVSAYEKGSTVPPVNILQILSEKFNVKIDDLVNYDISKNNDNVNSELHFNNLIEKKINDNTYSDLSEIDYLKQKSPEVLKNESKLFMMNYRQRLLDSLQLLMSLCKAMNNLGYRFSKKEINDIIYFEDFIETVKNFENAETPLSLDLKTDLINMLDKNLFGIISRCTYKIDTLIGDDGIHDWEDFIK